MPKAGRSPAMRLAHSRQGDADTCLYHAAYALTHDPAWLEWALGDPASCGDDLLFQQRLAKRGLLLFAHHTTERVYEGQVTPREFWEERRERWQADTSYVPLLVVIWGNVVYHAVAVALPLGEDRVIVSDSTQPGHLFLTWEEFLGSMYASAYRVEMLAPLTSP